MIGTASTGAGAGGLSEVFLWSGVLLAVAVAGGLVILLARKLLRNDGRGAEDAFTLHDLRELRDSGRITEEEFERAKAQLIARVRAPSDKETHDAGPPETSQPE